MPNYSLEELTKKGTQASLDDPSAVPSSSPSGQMSDEINVDGAVADTSPSSAPQTPQTQFTTSTINKALYDYRIISDARFVVEMFQSNEAYFNGAYVLFDNLFKKKSNILEYLKAAFIISLSKNHFILEPSIFDTNADAHKYFDNKESDWKMASWITSLGLTKKDLSSDKQIGLKKLLAYSIIKHSAKIAFNVDTLDSDPTRFSNSQYKISLAHDRFMQAKKLYPSLPTPEEKVLEDLVITKDYGVEQAIGFIGNIFGSQRVFVGKEYTDYPLIYGELGSFGVFTSSPSFECEDKKSEVSERSIASLYNLSNGCTYDFEADNIYLTGQEVPSLPARQVFSTVSFSYDMSRNALFYKPNHISYEITGPLVNQSNLVAKDKVKDYYLAELSAAEKLALPFSTASMDFTPYQEIYANSFYKLGELKYSLVQRYYQTGITLKKSGGESDSHVESVKFSFTDQLAFIKESYLDNRVKISNSYSYAPYLNLVSRNLKYRIHYKNLSPLYEVSSPAPSRPLSFAGSDPIDIGPIDVLFNSFETNVVGVNIYDDYSALTGEEKKNYLTKRMYGFIDFSKPSDIANGNLDDKDKAGLDFTIYIDLLKEIPNEVIDYDFNFSKVPEDITPYYAYEVPLLDSSEVIKVEILPPLAPLLSFYGLSKINNKVRVLVQKGLGELTDSTGKVLADGIDKIGRFELEVSEEPRFSNAFILEIEAPASSTDLTIEPNKKYYVRARSYGKLSKEFSDFTSIYQIELVDDNGVVIPSISLYVPSEKKMKEHLEFRKHFRLKPAFLQRAPNLINNQLDLGHLDKSVFGTEEDNINSTNLPTGHSVKPKFKIRITSKKTGKKIDMNVLFIKKKSDSKKEGSVLIFDS